MASYKVGGISLPSAPVMVGAGACKSPASAKQWLAVAPVSSGSYTPEKRNGNQGNHLFYPDTLEEFLRIGFGLNSFGMPNMNIDNALGEFQDQDTEMPLIVNIAGFSVDDYLDGVKKLCAVDGVMAIELNFGCPNTDHGKIMSFDPIRLSELFTKLGKPQKPIWVKFSPYSDPGLLKEVAAVVNETTAISAVVTCNTFPNAYVGKDAISPMGGLAGLSGPALKPISLGQVVQFRQHLIPEIDVIGVGGITTGNDVVDFLDAGAVAVQLTSLPFWMDNPSHFWEVLLHPDTGDRLEAYIDK